MERRGARRFVVLRHVMRNALRRAIKGRRCDMFRLAKINDTNAALLAGIVAILILPLNAQAQDYYPLEQGNSWTYLVRRFNPPTHIDSEYVSTTVASDTVLPNGLHYAHLTMPDVLVGTLIRADTSRIYYRSPWDSTESPVFNLTAPAGREDSIWWYYYMSTRITRLDTITIFGRPTRLREYKFDGLAVLGVTLAEGFGIVNALDWADGCMLPCTAWDLVSCCIRDTNYGVVLSVSNEEQPADFQLEQNYPNPFNSSTTIAYTLPSIMFVHLSIANILGQEIAVPVEEIQAAGRHTIIFDASQLATGVYAYTLASQQSTQHRRMLLLK